MSDGPFRFMWLRRYIYNSSYCHHHQIENFSRFRFCDISRGYVSDVVVPSNAVSVIYISRKLGFVPLLLCSLMMCANNRVHFGPMVVFVCLHITLHLTIMIMQTHLKVLNFWMTCQAHSVECVSKMRSILPIIFHEIYEAVGIQLAHPRMLIARIYVLYIFAINNTEIGTVCHFHGLCHETKLCVVCLSLSLRM